MPDNDDQLSPEGPMEKMIQVMKCSHILTFDSTKKTLTQGKESCPFCQNFIQELKKDMPEVVYQPE